MSDILIIGGYGHVGQIIARSLVADFPNQIIVAGRNLAKAQRMAGGIGAGVRARQVDVSATDGDIDMLLDGVGVVVMCLDLPRPEFVEQCFVRGIHYLDVTADYTILKAIASYQDVAVQNNAIGLLGVGLMPGLSNLLVKQALSQVPDAEHIAINLMLGLGDAHGEAAIRWTFEQLGNFRADVPRSSQQFLPPDYRPRTVYPFEFADQYIVMDNGLTQSATSSLCFDSKWVTSLIGLSRNWRIAPLLARESVLNKLIAVMKRASFGSDEYALSATAYQAGQAIYTAGLSGRAQSDITADVTAKAIRYLLQLDDTAGIFYLEQLFHLHQFHDRWTEFNHR